MSDPVTTVTTMAVNTTVTTIAKVTTEAPNPVMGFLSFGGLSLDPTSALLLGMFIGCIVGALYPEILQLLVPEDRGA
jgi:hypothetical protein